ncbi:dsRBD fold-containing protein [Streptomyces sp. TP-A0356]|uniref:dsRBD fold-containing protein n=1 Tax=Streptomyces sp. TP-A0356 TaxID=1359208 RepID=UPI0006E280D5|nr:dsRBD fold-containing protein [Streptomyces sp. TP-A0356]
MTRAVGDRPPSGKEWRLNLYLSEHDPATTARVVLDTGDNVLESCAEAHRSPYDVAVPEIGDELAAGRALISLGRELLRSAADDIAAAGASEEPAPVALWSPQE